jgi:hypothetical protein
MKMYRTNSILKFTQQHKFVSTFVLGDVMTCLYIIVKIKSIRGPLNVFKDYGAHGEEFN